MGDLSKHFSYWEVACQGENCCGGSFPIHHRMHLLLEMIRSELSEDLGKDTPLKINSGFRCKTHNATIEGASDDSRHIYGDAVDIDCPDGVSEEHLLEVVKFVMSRFKAKGGTGVYPGRIHMDLRGEYVHWDAR